jgi:hypothetical protein
MPTSTLNDMWELTEQEAPAQSTQTCKHCGKVFQDPDPRNLVKRSRRHLNRVHSRNRDKDSMPILSNSDVIEGPAPFQLEADNAGPDSDVRPRGQGAL